MEKVTSMGNMAQIYSPEQGRAVSSESAVATDSSNLASSAVNVEISTDGLNALHAYRRRPRSVVKDTIEATKGSLDEAMRRTDKLYQNFDSPYETDGDREIRKREVTEIIDSMWEQPSPSHHLIGEWAQHGKIINGRRTVTRGSDDIQYAMTRLFNDLKFDTKEDVYRSYSIMRYARAMMNLE